MVSASSGLAAIQLPGLVPPGEDWPGGGRMCRRGARTLDGRRARAVLVRVLRLRPDRDALHEGRERLRLPQEVAEEHRSATFRGVFGKQSSCVLLFYCP